MKYILKNEFVDKKGNKKTTFFVDAFDIPFFGLQAQITSNLNEAKRFKTMKDAEKWRMFFSNDAVIDKVD